ncbi:hypothetical protein E2320_003149 [Naja naja]|nr:hypothetical protein E2320_003149 [Naja naja]
MLSVLVLLQCNGYFLLPINLLFWAALVPKTGASPVPNSNPLYQFDGQVRLRHLYTANERINLHLEIFSDGRVRGSKYQNAFNLIQAISSLLQLLYSEEACNFREMVLRDGYNVYYSEAYNLPVSLSMVENLTQSHQLPPFSQFLPLINKIPLESMIMDYEYVQQVRDIESEDPFNIMDQNQDVRSPSFAFR